MHKNVTQQNSFKQCDSKKANTPNIMVLLKMFIYIMFLPNLPIKTCPTAILKQDRLKIVHFTNHKLAIVLDYDIF